MLQSLAITTLGAYQEGDRANVERAARTAPRSVGIRCRGMWTSRPKW